MRSVNTKFLGQEAIMALAISSCDSHHRSVAPDAGGDGSVDADPRRDVDDSPPDADQPSGGVCPREMGLATSATWDELCIDWYEAFIDEEGLAVSVHDVMPSTPVSWEQADEACRRAGKALCPAAYWRGACGMSSKTYPYGNTYQQGLCNDVVRGMAVALSKLKREYVNLGLTETQIHEIIPDARRSGTREQPGEPTEPTPA